MSTRRVLAAALPFLADPSVKAMTFLILVATIAQAEKADEPTATEQPLAILFSDLEPAIQMNFDPIPRVQTAAGTVAFQSSGLYQDENGNWRLPYPGGSIPY